MILQPRLVTILIPPIRAHGVDSIIQRGIREQNIERSDFLEFRDRNNLGKFILEDKELGRNPLLRRMPVVDFIPQLGYSSGYIESLGGQTQLSSLPTHSVLTAGILIINTSNTRLIHIENNEYILLTLTPLSEERMVNGFIQKIDLNDQKDYWLEISKIKK